MRIVSRPYIICLSALGVLLLYAAGSRAQSLKQDDIDVDYDACVARDTSCANVGGCAFIAYGRWEKQMNDTYDHLLRGLKREAEKAALREAQQQWTAYKEAAFTSYDLMFNKPGNAWCRYRHNARIDIVRQRTLQLRSYLEALRGDDKGPR